jgi:hypothetical protein
MNQVDEEVLPAPIIEDGLENPFEIVGGDVWEVADGGDTYGSFIRNMINRM